MRGRVVPVDAAAEHGDREAARLEGAAMRVAVDASREPADDDEPRGRQLAAEHPCDVRAVGGARAGADDRNRRAVEQLQLCLAAREQSGRRVEDRYETAREARRRARQPAKPAPVQVGQVGALVEVALESRETLATRSRDQMRVGVRRERGDMLGQDVVRPGQRGDRLRHPCHPGAAAAGQRQPLDRTREELVGLRGAPRHFRAQPLARPAHSLAHARGCLRGPGSQLDAARPRHGDDEIEAIEQRPRELVAERGQPLRRARALGSGVAARAARAEVHGRDELEARGKERLPGRAGDADDSVLERLAERLECRPHELRQLVGTSWKSRVASAGSVRASLTTAR